MEEEISIKDQQSKIPTATRFALSSAGSIPFVGGFIAAIAALWSEKEQEKYNGMLSSWIKLQEEEIKKMSKTLEEVLVRIDFQKPENKERVQSPEYLSIVKKSFKNWSAAESEVKRTLIRKLLTNAATKNVTNDDVIKMFVDWIEKYSDAHFKVI